MNTLYAKVTTDAGSRYMVRLCKHWSHKFTVEYDEQQGFIDFGHSQCWLRPSASALELELKLGPQQDDMPQVVAEHLQRMANKETLEIAWTILE